MENSQFEIFQEKGHGLLSSSLKISTRTGAAERNFNFNTQIQYYWTITRWSTQKHRMEAWQSTSFGSNTCRRQGMPISATSAWKDLLSHLLVLARVSTIFNVYFTIDTGIPPRQTASPALLLGLTLPSHTLLLLQLRTNISKCLTGTCIFHWPILQPLPLSISHPSDCDIEGETPWNVCSESPECVYQHRINHPDLQHSTALWRHWRDI